MTTLRWPAYEGVKDLYAALLKATPPPKESGVEVPRQTWEGWRWMAAGLSIIDPDAQQRARCAAVLAQRAQRCLSAGRQVDMANLEDCLLCLCAGVKQPRDWVDVADAGASNLFFDAEDEGLPSRAPISVTSEEEGPQLSTSTLRTEENSVAEALVAVSCSTPLSATPLSVPRVPPSGPRASTTAERAARRAREAELEEMRRRGGEATLKEAKRKREEAELEEVRRKREEAKLKEAKRQREEAELEQVRRKREEAKLKEAKRQREEAEKEKSRREKEEAELEEARRQREDAELKEARREEKRRKREVEKRRKKEERAKRDRSKSETSEANKSKETAGRSDRTRLEPNLANSVPVPAKPSPGEITPPAPAPLALAPGPMDVDAEEGPPLLFGDALDEQLSSEAWDSCSIEGLRRSEGQTQAVVINTRTGVRFVVPTQVLRQRAHCKDALIAAFEAQVLND